MSPDLQRLGQRYSELLCDAEEARDAGHLATAERLEQQAAELERQLEDSGFEPSEFIDQADWARRRKSRSRKVISSAAPDQAFFEPEKANPALVKFLRSRRHHHHETY